MKAAFFPSRFLWVSSVVLLPAAAAVTVCAQTTNWVLQTFDTGICGWSSLPPATLAFDPNQDDTGNGGGSCHVSFSLSAGAPLFLTGTFENCCFCESEVSLKPNQFAAVEFDLKWDNSSTVTPGQLNSNPGLVSPGIAIGLMNGAPTYGGYPTICYSNVFFPNAATGGWVHVSVPINQASPDSANEGIGLVLTASWAATLTGTAAFWLDNVKLVAPIQFIPVQSQRNSHKFTLQWTASPGSACTVLKSSDLVNWSILVTGYPPDGLPTGTASYTDTAATDRQSFYLIRTP
jgi:hypothetical protein